MGGGNGADYGFSTLWELWACSRTVSREGGGSRDPERTLSVLLLNVASLHLLQRSERLAALTSLSRQRPGISLYYTHAVPNGFILLVLPQLGFTRTGANSRARQGGGELPPSSRTPADPLDLPGWFQPPRRDPRVCDTHRPPGPARPVLEEAHNGV